MGKNLKICFVSTYIPRECGIATYTDNLMSAIKSADSSIKTVVVAMNDNRNYKYSDSVIAEINQDDDNSYVKAAEFINNSDVDVVSLQHEFGIFGGFNGNKILHFLKKIKKPVVITCHTVPVKLSVPYKIEAKKYKSRTKLLKEIFPLVSGITVMTETAKKYLIDSFNTPSKNIYVIPHGAPKISLMDIKKDEAKKESLGFNKDDFVISTFGLISPRKGLEYVIKALPEIIKNNPSMNIKYAILGKTHPKKPKTYLNYLIDLVEKLNLKKNVIFDSRYLSYKEIYCYLVNTNVYITPYYAKEQASSGTLSYAVAAGKCVVSTPYVFAQDLIKHHKVGELVNFRDDKSIREVLNRLVKNHQLISKYEKNSQTFGKNIEWPKIGQKFIEKFKKQVN